MENSATNTLKENKVRVEDIFKYQDELRRTMSNQNINDLRKCLGFTVQQLERIIGGDENVTPSSEERTMVTNLSRAFANIAVEKPIAPIFRDLSASFLSIVHNWNAATIKNPDIATNIRLTDGIIKAQLSLMETIDVLQKTLERMRKTNQYEPPAFNLSRAYVENLKKAVEEKGHDALVTKSE
jgi:hypothetical protein